MKSALGGVLVLICAMSSGTHAATHVTKKITQFGGPETRSRCIGQLKTKGLPACSAHGFKVSCHDTWIKTCTQWATDFKQHEYLLAITGPNAPDAVKNALGNAIERAFAAAIAAAAATPGEIAVKTAAAITAAKIAFAASVGGEPLLASVKNQYHLSLEQHSRW